MKAWLKEMKTSIRAILALALLLCGVYPAAVTLAGRSLFPARADGSLIERDGVVAGSERIAQPFAGKGYFHPRPSAAGAGYDATASGGSNLGPLSRSLAEAVRRRAEAYRSENGLPAGAAVPADAATASASGLDPDISLENARLQAPRVAAARGMTEPAVRAIIDATAEGRDLGIFGEPRVNVLRLNLALDGATRRGGR